MNAVELKFKKMSTAQLLVRVGKLSGEEKEACLSALKQRGQNICKWESQSPNITYEVSSVKIFEIEPEEELEIENKEDISKLSGIILKSDPIKENLPESNFPEGFIKGMKVKFIASRKSKTPGKELFGSIKRYTYDKQDSCFYFVIDVENKEYYKRPNAITAV